MKLLPAMLLASSLGAFAGVAATPALLAGPAAGSLAQNAAPAVAPVAPAGKIGDAAAKIEGVEYLKGTFDGQFKPGTVYVVEFWATWCPPCRKSIPHLSDLQKKFGDKIVVIGISNEKADVVKKFLADPNLKMEYIVAVAGQSKVPALYMKAFNQRGIPCAFIVGKDGNIAWVGHPMGMEKSLEEAVNK